jgi:flagellar biosynthetic protein FliP
MSLFARIILALGLFATMALEPAMAQVAAGVAASDGAALSDRVVQIFLAITVLSLAPGIAMMATCLPLIVIVLSILRQGSGLQHSPPNMLIMGLAVFLTYFVMEPVFADAWSAGVSPLMKQEIGEKTAFERTLAPFAEFMSRRVDPEAIAILADARGMAPPAADAQAPLSLLMPAFVLSEVQRAFEIGFVILLPFLIIDLLIASILMAMGMMMVPPGMVALPFKLCFFILTNGWVAVSGALVRSYT